MWKMLRSDKTFPVRIFVLALIVRLIPVLLSPNLGIGLDDMFQYDMLARSIESGNGFRWYAQEDFYLAQQYIDFDMSLVDYDPRGIFTSFRAPLYPTFLAIVYSIFGVGAKRFFIARIIQTFLGAALVPLTYLIAKNLLPINKKWNKAAAWIISFYPMLVLYPLSLATENLFFLLMVGSTWVLLIAEKNRKWYWFALAGVLLGLTSLTRSVVLVSAGLVVGWIWFALKERKFALITFIVICAVTLPWMVRNSILHHKVTGIESSLGYNLYLGYHPKSSGTFQYGISLDLIPYLDDGLRDKIGQNSAFNFIKSNPERLPYLTVRKLGYFFGLERRALTYFYSNNFFGFIPNPQLILISIIFLAPFVFICLSAAFGFAMTKWNGSNSLICLLIIGYLIPHILIMAEDRFHITMVPFLTIAAVQFWGTGWPLIKDRWNTNNGKIALITSSLISVLLISNWAMDLIRDRQMLIMLFGLNGNMTYFPY
jgi:4-amino-4-deoxy-L-arabinose transferase-like glycosyltransferase